MPRIIFPEFRDELEFTRYPFSDSATLLSSNTDHELEADVFLDASLHPIGGVAQLYISSIVVAAQSVTINVSGPRRLNLASVTFDPLDPPELLALEDAWGRPAGVLVSDALRLSRFSAWAIATHNFTVQATEFVSSCVIPTPEPGVRGLLTENGDLLAGDVWLVGDYGVVVRLDGECVIRIDVVGEPLFIRRLCQDTNFETPRFVKTINNCAGNQYGDYKLGVGNQLAEDTVLRINPADDGLIVEAVGRLVRNPT